MHQLTLEDALRARDSGMRLAADNAGSAWTTQALAWLTAYARSHPDAPWHGEDAVDDGHACGVPFPPNARAWGAVFLMAQRRGIIRRSDAYFRRRKGHATEVRGWETV